MANMLNALNSCYDVLTKELEGKTRKELIKMRDNAKKSIEERFKSGIDFDYCFASQKIDEATISIVNNLLDNKVKRSFKNCKLVFNNYYITVISEFNILIKNDKLGIDVNYNDVGRITGKGAKKYIEELHKIYRKVIAFRWSNKYLKEKNTNKYICKTVTKMTSKKLL